MSRYEALRDPLLANQEGGVDPWDPNSRMNARALPDDALDAASVNLEKIQGNIRSMKKLGADIGTSRDTNNLRERLAEGRRVTNVLIKETTNLLKQPVDSGFRAKQDKLKRTLQSSMQDFEQMSQEHRRKEREIVVAMEERYSQKYGSPPDLSGFQAESYGGSGGDGRMRKQTQYELDSQQLDDVDLAIIQDRNRDLQQLDQDMEQLADVFQDVNRMVGQQGEQIDMAAQNVEVAESSSASAAQSLKKGAEYEIARRKKIVIIVIIIVVVILVIVAIIIAWACTTGPLSGKCK